MVKFHEVVRVQVPAKINLALAVGPRRLDGFHDLTSVFQAVSVYDELTAVARTDGQIILTMSGLGSTQLPTDEQNLAVRAALLLRERRGRPEMGANLTIDKAIPIAGGMAGGSGDAAAALLGCNEIWDLELSVDELRELGTEIGSDVPFAILGGNAVGTGRGEKLTPLPADGELNWVFALAEEGLSTPQVYRSFDQLAEAGELTPDVHLDAGSLEALTSGDVNRCAAALRNDLCAAAVALRPALAATLAVSAEGVLASVLCGSGPTVAFLCTDEQSANLLAEKLPEHEGIRDAIPARGPVAGPSVVRSVVAG